MGSEQACLGRRIGLRSNFYLARDPLRWVVPKKPPLIAVVDDDPFVRKALERLLRSAGFSVEAFASGAEFLRSADDHKPDCVVLDLHMPDVSGFDVQCRLKQANAGVPVVVITGHDTPESRVRALDGGARAYLSKPVDDETLMKAINGAMVH
jgi:FixJ family two-component response regulator